MQGQQRRYRLGVDVGGTHTDLVLLDEDSGTIQVEKVSSTPHNPAIGVLNGVAKFVEKGVSPREIIFFSHGTTITTNALLEMRGAKVGMLVTKGFRGIQEVQNQARDSNLFDYFYTKPEPIAPRGLTYEIGERSDFEGNVLAPLNEADVREAARQLKAKGVVSIAVCYLFSYTNPAHEERTRALILEEYPDAQISLSSQVLPRIREWRRMSTTLLNAYLEPVMVHYIDHLNRGLDQAGVVTQQRFLMQSNGGVMPFAAAIAGGKTVHTLFSGPAGGAQASAYLARDNAAGRRRHPRHGRHQRRHRLHRRRRAARSHRRGDRPAPDRRSGARHDHHFGRRRLHRRGRCVGFPDRRPAKRRRLARAPPVTAVAARAPR